MWGRGLPGGSDVKKLTAVQETEFDPCVRKIPLEGNGNPHQCSWLEISCTDHGVTKSRTGLKWLSAQSETNARNVRACSLFALSSSSSGKGKRKTHSFFFLTETHSHTCESMLLIGLFVFPSWELWYPGEIPGGGVRRTAVRCLII